MSGNRSKSAFFEGGWVTLSADFRGKGASPTNHRWCQKTRVIAVSCGIKIFAVRCLVLSQYTHLTDGQTNGQNCDSNTVRCITCNRTVKMANFCRVFRLTTTPNSWRSFDRAVELSWVCNHGLRHISPVQRVSGNSISVQCKEAYSLKASKCKNS